MTYISASTYRNLKHVFEENHLSLRVQADHLVAEGSEALTKEKIRAIVESAGFCPLIATNRLQRNVVLTISPFKIPDFFNLDEVKEVDSRAVSQDYMNFDEITRVLLSKKFQGTSDAVEKDRWSSVNRFRSMVTPALNQCLFEILSQYAPGEHPMVEIGSGTGYSLSRLPNIIRTQPHPTECQLLYQSGTVYQTDIEGLHHALVETGKKVSVFFALDVFDTMTSELRKKSFLQLSQLQNSGDRIVIMLDTNPLLDIIINKLQSLYPDHVIFPYFPLSNAPAKFSVLLVPTDNVDKKPTIDELLELIKHESLAKSHGKVSEMQIQLHNLHDTLNLKVICLEDFFVEHVQQELAEAGYESYSYYHSAYVAGNLPPISMPIKQDLLYRSVTDWATVRQWALDDAGLRAILSEKKLALPTFSEDFLNALRSKNQKLLGAEILVVVATKKS